MFADIEGFVLTGGASSRMGTDKSRLEIGAETLAARAVRTLQSVYAKVSTVGGEPLENVPFFPDQIDLSGERQRAAIVGVHAALKNSKSEWSAILACDMPFVTGTLLQFLVTKAVGTIQAVVPVQPDGRLQPLCAIYRTRPCLAAVETAITNDDLSMTKLLEQIEAVKVDLDNFGDHASTRELFLNINTPDDLRKALEQHPLS
jgi:molybdopterin-guanine dinucleotide biosynthesis protein A